jgi:hypothetical protein
VSVAATRYVWEQSKAENSDRLVLLALADYADEEGNCFGSWGKLEEKTLLSRATIARAVGRLQESGELIMVEKGHRRIAGNGSEATVWRIAGMDSEMGLKMRSVSKRDPSDLKMRPNQSQNETPTISNNKEHLLGDTPATPSPLHPSEKDEAATGAREPKPRKAKVEGIESWSADRPLPHSVGFRQWWGEFVEFRRGKIKGRHHPLTEQAARIILSDLATVNEWQAVEAIKTAIASGYIKPWVDKFRGKNGAEPVSPSPRPSGPSALELSLQRARMEAAA